MKSIALYARVSSERQAQQATMGAVGSLKCSDCLFSAAA
jgi:hypothetical protein